MRIKGTIIFLFLLSTTGFANEQISVLINKIKEGPSVYYSPEAYSYFTRSGQQLTSQESKEVVSGSYNAAIKLGTIGVAASASVPVLLEKFPKAIHVAEVRNVKYSGEGSYDDWLQTYITNEKNKFILSSPFLDYNSMSLCEQFVETRFQEIPLKGSRSGIRDPKNVIITFTLNIGSCALSRITGKTFGNAKEDWVSWWNKEGSQLLESSEKLNFAAPAITIESGQKFSEIQFKAKYRMKLITGDELTGIIEFLDDTSLILETIEGKPYTFNHSIIYSYELKEPAPKKAMKKTKPEKEVAEVETISFEELQGIQVNKTFVEVTITNGSIFKGKLVKINNMELNLDIEGSVIPIQRSVISQIELIKQSGEQSKKKDQFQGPFDTLYLKVTETDEQAEVQKDKIVEGKIIKEQGEKVFFKNRSGEEDVFNRSQINRVIKHSTQGFEEPIKRYAKPLFCPDDMFLVDMPPGKTARPFFKVCVDRYEYPNRKGEMVNGSVSYQQAKELCEKQGKRICTVEEWQWACSGMEGYTYPYGWNMDEHKCNRSGASLLEASGSRVNCVSKFGGYDMVGNIFEWVSDSKGEPVLMGGPYSKCQTTSPGVGGGAKPQTGFRCCKSN